MKPTSRFMILSSGLVLLLAVTNARAAAGSIHPDTVAPNIETEIFDDAPSWELGTIFRPELDGIITHARVYSLFEESGEHQVRIWRNADEALLAGPIAWSFGGTDGWITLDIPDVTVEADQDYTISISTTAEGYYPSIGGYFGEGGTNGLYLGWPSGAGVFSDTAGARPTGGFGNATYLRDVVFEADLSGSIMRVQGNGVTIVDGSTIPSAIDGTDVGGKAPGAAGIREQTYTILNLGEANLELTGNPAVVIGGAHPEDFTVTVPPATTVAGGGSTTFTVRLEPSVIGLREATLSIARADSPADPYNFAIQGSGLGGGAGVLGNDSDGAFARNIDDAQIHGNRFQAPTDLRITQINARVLELAGAYRCAVYSDTDGFADTLLRSSEEVLFATNGWNVFPLTSPLDLTAGDSYWLVIWADTVGARVQADPVGGAFQGDYSYLGLLGEWPSPIVLTTPVPEGPRTYCIYAEGTAIGTAPGPELDLRGNSKLIVSGDTTPSGLDGTAFGTVEVGSGFVDQVFALENSGDTAIELTGNPRVSVTGPQAADFVVTSQPDASIAPGGSTSFTVRFDPSVRGLRSATVSIANNDPDETPCTFAIQGAGFSAGRETLWPDSKTGADIGFDGTYYELGTIFYSSVPGAITHLRVYSLASEGGDHTARLWRNDPETVVGGPYVWNYGGVTGWITLDIPDVEIEASVNYTVSVSTGAASENRNYPNIAADLLAEGGNGQSLFHPVNAGVFTETLDARPASSFNGGNYLRDVVFVPEGTVIDLPNMDVQGNGIAIADGETVPSVEAGTDFGPTTVNSGTVDHTFTIANVGTAPLNLGSTPQVAITGPNPADFTVIAQPATPIAPAANSSVTIRFAPSATGTRTAVVSIDNDSDESPYDFAVAGTGLDAAAVPRIVGITPNLTSGDITITWEGGEPQFQVEKAAAVTGPFQSVGNPQAERTFTDAGALTAGAVSYYRIRQGAGQD
ncbi:MAG: choice-of-anchor D domain-containing protein [Verrucomicrobia bacterium]|nr:choice-of-anchor D domain-containing protein [Verrucomicrobiota bacterium]